MFVSRKGRFVAAMSFTSGVRGASGCCMVIAERTLPTLPCDMRRVCKVHASKECKALGRDCRRFCQVCKASACRSGIDPRAVVARSDGSKCRFFRRMYVRGNLGYRSVGKGSGIFRCLGGRGNRGVLIVTSKTTFNSRVSEILRIVRNEGGITLCLPRSFR